MKTYSFSNEIDRERELDAQPLGSGAAGLTLCLTTVSIDIYTILVLVFNNRRCFGREEHYFLSRIPFPFKTLLLWMGLFS